jgi:trimeric autotransporter adhesin
MKLTRLTYALATAGFTSALLVACGGSDDNTASPPAAVEPPVVIVPPAPTTSAQAVTVAGLGAGALVCLDKNANGACEAGETQGTTGAEGTATLAVPLADVGKYSVLVEVSGAAVGTAYSMVSPADKPAVVSPLTTLVATQAAAARQTTVDAEKNLQDRLGTSAPLMTDYSKGTDDASKYLGNVARTIVVATQKQLTDTAGAKAADGTAVPKNDIVKAVNNGLLSNLATVAAQASDPAVMGAATPAAKEAAIQVAATVVATAVGLTPTNTGAVVATAAFPPKATPATPAISSSLRWFNFTDAGNYNYRQFNATAAQETPVNGLRQFTEYRESKATAAGAVTSFVQWGGGLNNAQRNVILWTGTEWFDCPNDYVSESSVYDANGVVKSNGCNAYKTSSKAVVRDVAGLKMVDVVKDIRAYPLYDNAGKFTSWGPDPVTHATALNAVFPAGSKLDYFTTQDLSVPDSYSPLGSDTVVAFNAGAANGVAVDCNKLTLVAANNIQYRIAVPTLEKMVSSFIGKPCVYTNATTLADTGEATSETWDTSSVSVGDVTDAYTNAKGYYRSGVKRLRASFGAGNVVNFWSCLIQVSAGVSRNCVAVGSGTYSVETLGDSRVMRIAGLPANAASLLTYNRIFVERAGKVQYGSRSKPALTNSIRPNKEATDALFAALSMPAKQAAAPLTATTLVASYINGAGVVGTNALPLMENDATGLTGAWELIDATALTAAKTTFFFFANGQYVMADPVGDVGAAPRLSCGNAGLELGTYSFARATGRFTTLTTSKDTNGCSGLNDATQPANTIVGARTLVFSTDGKTLTASGIDNTGRATSDVFSRVSK